MSLAVVQAVSNAYKYDGSTTTPKFTWGAQPTNGNLLIGIVTGWSGAALALAAGWTLYTSNLSAGPAWQMYCVFKYAGASEPTTVTIDTNSHIAWSVQMWEISGVTGSYWKDIINVGVGAVGQSGPVTTISPSSPVTTQSNALTTLALYALNSYSTTASTTYTWSGTGWVADSSFCTATADGSNGLYDYATGAHKVITTSTTLTPTITANHSSYWGNSFIELGNNPGPAVDFLSIQSAGHGGAVNTAITSLAAPSMTAQSGAVIVAVITASVYQNATPPTPPFATTPTATGLTFTQRFRQTLVAGSQVQQEMVVYWAPAASGFSGVITANFSGMSGSNNFFAGVSIQVFAIMGGNTSTPWDSNASLPKFANANFATGVSTTNATTLMLAADCVTVANNGSIASGGIADPWVAFASSSNGNPGGGAVIANTTTTWGYNKVTLSSVTINQVNGSGGSGWVDALVPGVSTESGAVTMAMTKVSFNVTENDPTFANKRVTMALSGVSFSGAGNRVETLTGSFGLAPVAFSAQAHRQESGNVSLALSGVTISVAAVDLGAAGSGAVHFATFGA